MDRVWVPSEFNKTSFASAGVDLARIAVIPEALDADLYQTPCEPLELNWGGPLGLLSHVKKRSRKPVGSRPYRFISVFDWSLHKGPDLLLEAFATEFGNRPDVEMVIKTWSTNFHTFEDIIGQADAMLIARTGRPLKAFANIHIFQTHLASTDMPRLYRACDCFVTPTRGDAWLRPLMEAMAVGLPTIATGWSGLTAYHNSSVGYPVKFKVVPVSEEGVRELSVYRDQSWAEPDIADLRRLMRHVEKNRVAATRKGSAARKHILANYSRQAVAKQTREELAVCREMANRRAWPQTLLQKPPATRVEERLRLPKPYPSSIDPVDIVDFVARLGRPLRVALEGDICVVSSLAHVNRELCLELLARGDVELTLSTGIDFSGFPPEDAERYAPLLACSGAELSGPPDITIRHHWPPKWDRPDVGKLIVMQPWELSHLPGADWVNGAISADEVWVYSRFVRDIYVRSGVPAEKVRVVPLGVRTEVFSPDGPEYPLPLHPVSGRRPLRYLYVGGTVDRKGADLLLPVYLRTFTRESEVCLVVKDMGVDTFYRGQNFAKAYKQAQADPNGAMVVHFDEAMSEAELASVYRSCDRVILPSRGEGFGLGPLEGAACGLTSIVTAGGPMDEYLSDETAFRVPYHRRYREGLHRGPGAFPSAPWDQQVDFHALSQALHRVNDDRAGAKLRGAAARAQIEKGWTWRRSADVARARLLEIVLPAKDLPAPPTTPWHGVRPTGKPSAPKHRKALKNGARIRLSLCMIVRDESKRLKACLESAAPYFDEMIVLDTGSTDNTREIALACGAKVYERKWTDSFAEARNASFDLASGEWIFWMDADDIISPECGAMLRDLIDRHPNRDAAYQVQVRIPPGPGEFSATLVDHVKLVPNRPEFRFEHRIHEQILPSLRRAKIDVRFSEAFVTHQNYDRSAEGQDKKRRRDFRLLYLDLLDHPDHPFVLFNLGMTYLYAVKDFEVAAHYLWRSLKASDWRDSIVRKAYALLTTARICQEEWELAITSNESGRAHYPEDAELLFQAGQIYQQLGKYDEAKSALERLLAGEDDPHYRSVDSSLRGYRGQHEIALLHRRLGDAPHCEQVLREIVSAQPDYLPGWKDLVDTLVSMGREDEARKLMSALPASGAPAVAKHPVDIRPVHPIASISPPGSAAVPPKPRAQSSINDCLARARITLPETPLKANWCIASVVSPGYEGLLDCFLGSLRANGCVNDANGGCFPL